MERMQMSLGCADSLLSGGALWAVGCGLWAVTLSLDSRLRTDDVVFGNSGADPDRRKEAKARARNEKRENEKESL